MAVVDYIIILSFIVLAIFISIRSGKKIKNFNEYITYYKSYNPRIGSISLSMVLLGSGSIIGTFEETHKGGGLYLISSIGYVIGSVIFAKYIVPRFSSQFNNLVSVCDVFKNFYGKEMEKFAAVPSIIFDLLISSTNLIIIAQIISIIIDIRYEYCVISGILIILFYSSFGGIRALTLIDLIKCALVLIFIPILTNYSIYNAGGITRVLEVSYTNYKNIFFDIDFPKFFCLFIFFLIPIHLLQPVVVQRILLISDNNFSQKALYNYALIRMLFIIMIGITALSAIIDYKGYSFISYVNISLPDVLKGFILATIIILLICKLDAHLNSASIIFSKNLIKNPFSISDLLYIRIITILMGVFIVIISLFNKSIINLTIFMEAFWGCSIGIPLLATLLRLKISFKGLIKYLIFNLITSLFLWSYYTYYTPLLMTAINGCIYLSLYFFKTFDILDIKKNTGNVFKKIAVSLLNLKNIYKYSNNRVDIVEADYWNFSLFYCISCTIPYFLLDFDYNEIIIISSLRSISILLCLILVLKPLWPKTIERFFSLYWHLILLIALPFSSFFILFLDKFSIISFVNTMLSIFLLGLLVDWLSFIFVSFFGIVLSTLMYKLTIGKILSSISTYNISIYIYAYIFSFLIIIIFNKKHLFSFKQKLNLAYLLGSTIAHELRTYLVSIQNHIDELKLLDQITLKKHSLIRNILRKAFTFISRFLINVKGPSKNNLGVTYDVNKCILYSIKNYPFSDSEQDFIKFEKKENFIINCDKELIAHVFFNLINNALYYSVNQRNFYLEIYTTLGDRYNYVIFEDNGPGIAMDRLTMIFKNFYSYKKSGTGLGLSFCKSAINNIGGDIYCDSIKGEYTKFIIKFPKLYK